MKTRLPPVAAIAALTLLATSPAQALSCLRPDPLTAMNAAVASDQIYGVLKGTLTFDDAAMPDPVGADTLGPDDAPETPAPVPARFVGTVLDRDGFTRAYEADVTLQPTCAGSWCGTLVSGGDEALIFARATEAGSYVIDVDPCAQWIFPAPDAAVLDAITACATGGSCEP